MGDANTTNSIKPLECHLKDPAKLNELRGLSDNLKKNIAEAVVAEANKRVAYLQALHLAGKAQETAPVPSIGEQQAVEFTLIVNSVKKSLGEDKKESDIATELRAKAYGAGSMAVRYNAIAVQAEKDLQAINAKSLAPQEREREIKSLRERVLKDIGTPPPIPPIKRPVSISGKSGDNPDMLLRAPKFASAKGSASYLG